MSGEASNGLINRMMTKRRIKAEMMPSTSLERWKPIIGKEGSFAFGPVLPVIPTSTVDKFLKFSMEPVDSDWLVIRN